MANQYSHIFTAERVSPVTIHVWRGPHKQGVIHREKGRWTPVRTRGDGDDTAHFECPIQAAAYRWGEEGRQAVTVALMTGA